MKIQGRFIAVLAVLGLLIALLPLAPAGAVTGVVNLSGGADDAGQYFSDQSGNNILTIQVEDADLTPTRVGTARLAAPQSEADAINLVSAVVAGEKDQTDSFDGGTTNGPCDESELDGVKGDSNTDDGFLQVGDLPPGRLTAVTTAGTEPDPVAGGAKNIVNDRCRDTGDGFAIVVVTETGVADTTYSGDADDTTNVDHDDNTATPELAAPNADYTLLGTNETRSVVYRFELKDGKVARDRQANGSPGVGVVGISDIVRVVVNGRTANAGEASGSTADDDAPEGNGPWYTVTALAAGAEAVGTTTPGGGIKHVFVRRATPQPTPNSVSVSYKYSEFDFSGTDTPLDDRGSSVQDGGATTDPDYTDATGRVSLARTRGTSLLLNADATGSIIVTFAYDVKDEAKELVTLNSGSVDRKLDTMETSADSDTFQTKVAIFSREDLATIRDEAGADANDTDADSIGTITVGELNGRGNLGSADISRSIIARVNAAATALFDDPDTNENEGLETSADDFLAMVVPARHGDVINVVYVDNNPSVRVSKTATVDLEAPVVTLITPTDNFFTNTSTVSFSVDVVDTGAGVPDSSDGDAPVIETFGDTGIVLGSLIRTPIVDGYRLTVNPDGSLSEGTKRWYVGVRDKVGNEPVMDAPDTDDVNEAPKGAAGLDVTSADNPFKFTVDTRAPELSAGMTGRYLKNPGVTSGNAQETEASNSRTWVKVEFNTHLGGAPLDASTVTADDFRVDGLAPLDAKINAKTHGDSAKGEAVYLQVGQLDTDARPEIQLTGEIKDKAGNIRTEGRLTAIADGLKPILEVTPSADLAESEITVTITSSETLRRNPTVKVTDTKPVKGGNLDSPVTQSVSLVAGNLTTWTTIVKNSQSAASRKYVTVEGTDLSDNTKEVGIAATETDIVTFQLDDADPSLKFVDASGADLEDSEQTEGAVWLVAQFDEDEHADDKSRGVTITALTLTDEDNGAVITDDVSAIFGSEEDCVDHDTDSDRYDADDANNDCANRTLAVNLTPGAYNIEMTGVDASGNETADDVDFTVVEADPFTLDLRPGINFISIPGMPMADGGDINVMLGDHPVTTVSTYDRSLELQGQNPWLRSTKDAETGMFSGDITMIEPGKAYFITATASSEVSVKIQRGVTELPPTITVRQGYNAIGFWSVSGDSSAEIDDYLNSIGWTVAYSYDPTPGRGWATIRRGQTNADGDGLLVEEGKGYLVYATYDSVLTP